MRVSARFRVPGTSPVAFCILGALACRSALPQASVGARQDANNPEHAPLEVFQGPRAEHLERPNYPNYEVITHGEGWVKLGFMVNTAGKPFEVTVVDSTGNKDFEKAAVGALERSTFRPGMADGHPTDSGGELTYRFLGGSDRVGARPQFIDAYDSFLKALAAKDKSAADAAMSRMKITNLYEDAFFGLARYNYARLWGTDAQQLEGLMRATVNDGPGARYLPKAVFQSAMDSLFDLEVKTHEYAEALATWKRRQKTGVDAALAAKVAPTIDRLNALRNDGEEYGVSGVMQNGGWFLRLFKRHFRIEVAEGYISQVKLRCDGGYVYFAFDPKLRYDVDGKYGGCWMELLGAPGAKFTLFQY